MALERELNNKKQTNSFNYSIYNQMSQQQAGKGVNMSHQSFLSNHLQHARYASRSPDERAISIGRDNNMSSIEPPVNMSSASHCFPSPISNNQRHINVQQQNRHTQRGSHGPSVDGYRQGQSRYEPPSQLSNNFHQASHHGQAMSPTNNGRSPMQYSAFTTSPAYINATPMSTNYVVTHNHEPQIELEEMGNQGNATMLVKALKQQLMLQD